MPLLVASIPIALFFCLHISELLFSRTLLKFSWRHAPAKAPWGSVMIFAVSRRIENVPSTHTFNDHDAYTIFVFQTVGNGFLSVRSSPFRLCGRKRDD